MPFFFQVFYSVLFIKKDNVFIVSIDSMWGGVNYNSRYLHHEISCDEKKYSFYVLQKKKPIGTGEGSTPP